MGRVVALLCLPLAAGMAQWPQFRGPEGKGVADVAALPLKFTPGSEVWRTDVPPGHSSPVIWGDRIFLTGATGGKRAPIGNQKVIDEGGKLFTICLDRNTGRELWRREAPRPRLEQYQPTNSPASPSPVTDGRLVYVFFGDFGVIAYDLDGNEKWKLPLGPFNNVNGHGSSPVLSGDTLLLLCDQDTGSYMLAVNKRTGKQVWKTPRPEATRSYATPAVWKPAKGPAEVVVPGAYSLTAYDLATGKKLWWIQGLSWQPKSTPIIDGDIVYAHWWENGGEAETTPETPTFDDILGKFDADKDGKLSPAEVDTDQRMKRGFLDTDLGSDGFIDKRDWDFYRARRASKNALLAVRLGGRGELTDSKNIIWRMQKFLPNVPSPLLYQGVIYLVKDGGILTTVDARTGATLKQGRLPGALDTYYASPVAGGGHVYFLSQRGKLTVVKAGGEWEPVTMHDFAEDAYSTPAIIGDTMYIRTHSALWSFRASK